MVPWRISKLILNLVSRLFAAFTHEILSLTLEEKFHISALPYIILYVFDLSECVPGPNYTIDQYCFVEGCKFELKGWDWENTVR